MRSTPAIRFLRAGAAAGVLVISSCGANDAGAPPGLRAPSPARADTAAADTGRAVLTDTGPDHVHFRGLVTMRRRLAALRDRGGWVLLPQGDTLRPGASGIRVGGIQERLQFWGDLVPGSSSPGFYDSTLAEAVRRFQRRHGCAPTGEVDSVTLSALNVPPSARLRQVDSTAARWRRFPGRLGRRYILVNIPDYRLEAVEGERTQLEMKVVVGLPLWPTPVFTSHVTVVIINPYWFSPARILASELINYIKADSNYLRSNGMIILRGQGADRFPVDPHTIDWPSVQPGRIDFQLRQDPGPQNIMGQVKFVTPNPFDVFLHDTPYREDFGKTARLASHGCIRLDRAWDFTAYLLRGKPEWTPARLDTLRTRRKTVWISLEDPVPVHVVYATAWLDSAGRMQFRPDPYGCDRLDSIAERVSP